MVEPSSQKIPFYYNRKALGYVVENPDEATTLLYLTFPHKKATLERERGEEVNKHIKNLMKEGYVEQKGSLLQTTPLGKLIAWNYIAFIRHADRNGVSAHKVFGEQQATMARKILKEMEKRKQ